MRAAQIGQTQIGQGECGAAQIRADQRPLTALRPAAQASVAVQQFKLPDAAATIQILCVDR